MGILNTTVNVKDIKREATLTAQLAIDATDEKIFRTLSKDTRAKFVCTLTIFNS